MILLTSTSDLLRIITTSAGQVDVYIGYVDNTAINISPARTSLYNINTATTTTILSAPPVSTERAVKYVSIKSNTASVGNTITLQHYDGTNYVTLWKGILAPGEMVVYDGNSFKKYNSSGVGIMYQITDGTSNAALWDLAYGWGDHSLEGYLTAATLPVSNYIHNQLVVASVWSITHNLGFYPSVTIVDSGETQVIGDVTYINNNQLEVSFSVGFSGKAYLS